MKKQIALLGIVLAALVAVPTLTRAEDKPATPPGQVAPAAKKHLPFNGKVAAVDTAAETVTVGKMVLHITSETKIVKHGKRATLAEVTVGEKIGGSYEKKDEQLNAIMIRIGEKVKPENAPKPAEKAK